MKLIEFAGSSLRDIRSFPTTPRREAGHQLDRVLRTIKDGVMMSAEKNFSSVWDAIEDDPVRVRNLKLRSELMIRINSEITALQLTQTQAAELLHLTQPRVSALLRGKIEDFRLDSLVDIAHRLGLGVKLSFAA